MAARRQDPSPLRRGLKVHSWKGRSKGGAAGKGRGPGARGTPRRAGGALGCHKVNGRRRGVALHREANSLLR